MPLRVDLGHLTVLVDDEATGTRIPVTVILDSLAEGTTKDEVLASYPSLGIDHINAALAYAAELAHEERLVPIRAM